MSTSETSETDLPMQQFEELRRRYDEERDARVGDPTRQQYRKIGDIFPERAADLFAGPRIEREPVVETVDVTIVGAGYSGLITAVELRKLGIDTIRIIERAGDFGGTWYWNRYPGAACDTESYIYMPFLEETGYIPTEKYAKATEIFAHCQRIGRIFGLYRAALFQTEARSVIWNDTENCWVVRTDRGDVIQSRFIVLGTGILTGPKIPEIPGVEDFEGHTFHSSRWDYGYTGGSPGQPLTNLQDKVVGVVGTGATGVQMIPELARASKHLYVFQRTPSTVDIRGNRETDPEWASQLQPGWQRQRIDNFNAIIAGMSQEEDLVADGWTDIFRKMGIWRPERDKDEDTRRQHSIANMTHMEAMRERIGTIVRDPGTAEALKPYYELFCKRPGFHDSYLDTFNRDNVTLVDTKGKSIERFESRNVFVGGKAYELDCLVFSTGFSFALPADQAGELELRGINGTTLAEKWRDGVRSLYGILHRGFPNMFVIGNAIQSAVTINFPSLVIAQAPFVARMIRRLFDENISRAEPSPQAEIWWRDEVIAFTNFDQALSLGCTPGYFNGEGTVGADAAQYGAYARGLPHYEKMLEDKAVSGFRDGIEFQNRS